MKRLFAAGLAVFLLGAGAPSQAAAPETPILPGYWKYSAKTLLGLINVKSERRCIKADEIDRFIAFPGNRHYKCSYPVKTVGDGKVAMQGVCVDKRGREAPIRATGTYTPESFRLNVQLTTTNGIPVSGTMTAQRLSADCPA